MLRRVRTDASKVICFYYDQTRDEEGTQPKGLVTHPCPEKLWFAERDDDLNQRATAEDYHTIKGLVIELGKMQALREMFAQERQHLYKHLPLDTRIKYVNAGNRRYPVYCCGGSKVLDPESMTEVSRVATGMGQVIDVIHKGGYLIWNLHPKMIYKGEDAMLGPSTLLTMRKVGFPEPLERGAPAPSILLGCTIASPYQVLLDMLGSKYEKEEIEYNEFKQKFTHFWGRVLPPEYRHVPDVCQLYHSMKQGSTEYIDAILCKWCTIKTDTMGRKIIVKDPSAILKPSMLYGVDWFAFGITLDAYVELVMEKQPDASPPQSIVDMIHLCIYGENPLQ